MRAFLSPLLLLGLVLSLTAPAGSGQPDRVRVLLIGNSFLYYHNMPAILEALSDVGDGARIEAEMVVEPGASLADHLAAGEAAARIAEGGWDHVILMGQSTFGRVFLIRGQYRVGGAGSFLDSARRFDRLIRDAGAQMTVVAHWKAPAAPATDQAMIDHACSRVAGETGARVAAAGAAFQAAARERPSLSLYDDDHHHPSAAGSYLLAAVLHATILGRSPEGGPGTIHGTGVDPDTGSLVNGTVRLVDLPAEDAVALQRIAYQVAAAPAGHLQPAPPWPPALELPVPPRGRHAAPADLVGRWSGPIDLYPWLGTLHLELSAEGADIAVRARISFGGAPDDIEIEPSDTSFDGRRLEFVDPAGPNGSSIRYTAVLEGERLVGIAEMTDADDSLYGRGTLRLARSIDRAP